jgi:hypothetical protein
MKRVPSVVWFAIRNIYDELFPLSGMGVIWFVMAVVPPLGIFELTRTYLPNNPALGIVLILISLIPAPPATAALYYVTSFIARQKRIEFNYFWQGLKTYFWKSQEEKRLLSIFKNGSLLTLAYPFFALGILLAMVLFTAASVLLIILLPTLWMPFVTLLNNRALVSSLGEVERYQQAQEELDQEREEQS